jgi:hypothetical protein
MSKRAKTRAKEERRKRKAARKAAMKAQYQAWKEKGINTKSKRATKQNKKKSGLVSTEDHPFGTCGNPGCKECYGWTFPKKFFLNGKPHKMPQKMYQAWLKNQEA